MLHTAAQAQVGAERRIARTLTSAAAASSCPPLGILHREMKALSIWNCARDTRAAPASGGEGSHPRNADASTMGLSALKVTGAPLHWGFRVHQHGITGIVAEKER